MVEKRLGALPVAAEFLRRLDVAGIVDELCPTRACHAPVRSTVCLLAADSPVRLFRIFGTDGHVNFSGSALPLDVRVAAALVRLYALPLTRIVELTDEHISRDQEHTYLAVNQHPFVLPPKLARLIDDQLRHSTPRHSTTAGRRYLLPGQSPGRPRNPLGLADTLRHHGLPARAARNTAMMDALADLPPMVIADLLGIHPKTAERWATLAGENWSEYLSSLK
ncbi:hypothetical protein OG243_44385 [Streptomyces sp. NBC_01318]|uniref:hypothetical protein n=1 Tax=Streptomyces sp. NBC_01318 TaxID=2903823 RepID=UPI002E0E0A60|nr:hypothetical protein OG243_00160 [Streptomyces sp. NBC_01318]WSJ55922.1 hypothetical protein OG243_44385 [Streptomyces sp. NBC_01318]